jgi:hypothetical protein
MKYMEMSTFYRVIMSASLAGEKIAAMEFAYTAQSPVIKIMKRSCILFKTWPDSTQSFFVTVVNMDMRKCYVQRNLQVTSM